MAGRAPSITSSQRFNESVDLIPTPGVGQRRPARYEPLLINLGIVALIALLMIGLAVALEVALHISNVNNGFAVPRQNAISFLSTQFLTSFTPTLLVMPLALLWYETDYLLKWSQPYVTLSQKSAPADEALLLDYTALNKILILWKSFHYRHWLIFISSITALAAALLQPLAGSIFQIKQLPQASDTVATSTCRIGLAPDVAQFNAFLAAAGYTEAAVFHQLPDPPFVCGCWSSAEFDFPTDPLLNGTMSINTTAIQTLTNCNLPETLDLSTSDGGNFTINATSVDGCVKTINFDPDQQYGVSNVPDCSNATDIVFQPVLFWFFHTKADKTPEAQGVFCNPTIEAFNVIATANLNDGSLSDTTIIDNRVAANNVTGGPLSGQAYNAVVFDDDITNPFIRARAMSVNNGVPGAMFRYASQLPDGPASTFASPAGFLNITDQIYTQHLALTAKAIYFLPANDQLPARLTSILPRLVISPLSAHGLAAILFCIGIVGLFVHFSHRHARRNLWLTSRPGSIAAIVSLTARSGFGDLLVPYDTERSITQKLKGLTFRLDRRTGAIVADDDGTGYDNMRQDDVRTSLLSSTSTLAGPVRRKDTLEELYNPHHA